MLHKKQRSGSAKPAKKVTRQKSAARGPEKENAGHNISFGKELNKRSIPLAIPKPALKLDPMLLQKSDDTVPGKSFVMMLGFDKKR
jgi:hypothetical protein